jgi:hypothetical protein
MAANRKVKPLAQFYRADANYIAERIGELHCHAMMHEGELCEKLNRARIGGMIEVLNRMSLEVDCNWKWADKGVLVMTDLEYLRHKELLRGASAAK